MKFAYADPPSGGLLLVRGLSGQPSPGLLRCVSAGHRGCPLAALLRGVERAPRLPASGARIPETALFEQYHHVPGGHFYQPYPAHLGYRRLVHRLQGTYHRPGIVQHGAHLSREELQHHAYPEYGLVNREYERMKERQFWEDPEDEIRDYARKTAKPEAKEAPCQSVVSAAMKQKMAKW